MSTRERDCLQSLVSKLSFVRRGLVGCALALSVSAFAAEPIKLGEIESMTGKDAAFGQSSHKGVQMAVEELNARGGLLGRPVVLVVEDNQSKAGDSTTVAKKLVNRDKVAAVICGGTSTNCLEIGPIAQAGKVPLMATTATDPKVTEKNTYVFRNCFIDPFQGPAISGFALDVLKAKRLALLTSISAPYSVGLSKVVRETFVAKGGTIVADSKYNEGDKDFRAQLTAIRAAKPDVIAITGYYTEAALICKQARDLGLTCPLIGGDGWEAPELVEIGGAAVNDSYYSTHYSAESTEPKSQDFVKKFRAKFDGEIPDSLAPLAYDATMIIAEAITRAGTTEGPKLRDALAATKDFPGVTGKTTIDPNRNASKAVVIVTIKDGHTRFVQTFSP